MQVTTSEADNGVVLLQVEGAVDAYTAPRLGTVLSDLVGQGQVRLVLDGSQMTFISSAGLRAILFAHREVVQRGGEVRVFGLAPRLQRVFDIAGFYLILRISDTLQEAMEGW